MLQEELEVKIYKQYLDGVNAHDDGRKICTYKGTIPSIPLLSLLDTHLMLSALEGLAGQVTPARPAEHPHAHQLDRQPLQGFADGQCYTRQAQRLMSLSTRLVLGLEPAQVSVLYFANYAASAGGMRPLLDSDGGGQDSRISGGTIALLQRIVQECDRRLQEAEAGSLTINLGLTVREIDYSGSSGEYITMQCDRAATSADDGVSTSVQLCARRVVMTTPPSSLNKLTFTPTPPAWKRSLWTRARAGHKIKVVVQYAEPFWRTAGYSGSAVCERPSLAKFATHEDAAGGWNCCGGEAERPDRPLSGVFDYCDDGGAHAALCCFIAGDVGIDFGSLDEAAQRAAVFSHLVHLFGAGAAEEHCTDYLSCDWAVDAEATRLGGGGCSADVSGIGFFAQHSKHLRTPLWRNGTDDSGLPPVVFFAGTETASSWIGYMDGAVESGGRVAAEVLASFATSSADGSSSGTTQNPMSASNGRS